MKRKMIGAAAAYLAGLFFASFFTGIISAAAFLFLVILVLAGGIRGKDLILLLVCFAVSFTVSRTYKQFYHDRIISHSGVTADFSGRIKGIERYSGDLAMYILEGELNGIPDVKITYLGSGLNAEYGDRLHLQGCTFSQHKNDYVFRNRDIFMSENVFLNADYPENVRVEQTHSMKLKNVLMDYREKTLSEFRRSMDGETGNFLGAMVFGEKRDFDPDMRTALYRSGIGHVMAVSGLHVSVIAVMLMALFSRLRIGKIIPFVFTNILLFLFITMADWPVSAVRAAIMAEFVCSAKLFRRQSDTFNSLAGAVLVICIANPFAVYSSGFLMSVTAAFGVGVFGPYMTKNFSGNKIIRNFLIMVCTSICIFPLTIKYFGETSLLSPITNLILLPLCSAALIVGVFFVMTGGVLPVLGAAEFLLKPVLAVSEYISENRIAYFCCGGESSAGIIFALSAVVVVVYVVYKRRNVTAFVTAAAFCISMIFTAFSSVASQDSLKIAILGKGKNTAAVITYKGVTRIFDLSGYYNSPVYIRKYLAENGISHLDSIFIAGNEPSQYAAYKSELASFETGKWYTGDNIFASGRNVIQVDEEISFTGGDLEIVCRGKDIAVDFCGTEITVEASGDKDEFVVRGDLLPQDFLIDKNENNFEIKLSEDGSYEFRRL